jgi:hypothetical protein
MVATGRASGADPMGRQNASRDFATRVWLTAAFRFSYEPKRALLFNVKINLGRCPVLHDLGVVQ